MPAVAIAPADSATVESLRFAFGEPDGVHNEGFGETVIVIVPLPNGSRDNIAFSEVSQTAP